MFKTDELKSKWDEWILERKDRKIKKYTERGERAAKTHLLAISQNNESIAVKIIEQSIAQGWTGLFPLKNYTNGTNKNLGKSSGFALLNRLAKGEIE